MLIAYAKSACNSLDYVLTLLKAKLIQQYHPHDVTEVAPQAGGNCPPEQCPCSV